MEKHEKIAAVAPYFPMIRELTDSDTAAKVAQVWLDMLKLSSWETIEQARFKEGYDKISLVSHVNSATEAALAFSKVITKYHGIPFDEKKLITFGLLHDVDKMVEYAYDESGELVITELGKKIQHGVLSAMLARDAGFDWEMIHLILTHTPSSAVKTTDKEGILFGYADLCDWDLTCRFTKR
ncbi:MAG: HDIG domain-containing protein [Lachnospiraceae bacterium]|nr:HDIG domain-containing protein [Lachnospiraceae bacterium]